MKNKYQHLLNINEQRIILLGGIPGSGKSTLAKEFEEAGYKIICPDTYRGIISKGKPERKEWTLAMHESDQSVSKEAWEMAHKEALDALKNGYSILFDAMLHTAKARRKLFSQLDKANVPYYAIYNDVELQTALDRNEKRANEGGRRVPEFVISDVWRVQAITMIEEGFKETITIHNDLKIKEDVDGVDREKLLSMLVVNTRETVESLYENGELEELLPSLSNCWNISQDNVHHTQKLHEHMIKAAELIEDKDTVSVISALLHDVGKSKTKEFFVKIIKENEHNLPIGEKYVTVRDNGFAVTIKTKSYQKGSSESLILLPLDVVEKDLNAHFYNHEQVGAMMARRDLIRLGFDDNFANSVYANILYHMDLPYNIASNKSMNKLIKKVTKQRMRNLLAIRKADKLSSGTSGEGFEALHNEMVEQVENILK